MQLERLLDWFRAPFDPVLRSAMRHAREVGFVVYPECERCGRETPYPCLYCGYPDTPKDAA